MRVVVVSHLLPPRHEAGTEVYSTRLAAALSRRHEVVLFAADDDPLLSPGVVRRRRLEGVDVVEVAEPRRADRPDDSWENPRAAAAFDGLLAEMRPDVVHFQNLRFLGFGLVAAAKRAGARTVLTLNDPWLLCARDGLLLDRQGAFCPGPELARCTNCLSGYRFGLSAAEATVRRTAARVRRASGFDPTALLRRAALALRRRSADATAPPPAELAEAVSRRLAARDVALAAVDRFIAPSRFIAASFVAAGVAKERITVLSYGVDGPESSAARAGGDRAAAISSSGRSDRGQDAGVGRPLRVGFFGIIAPHKGADVLVDAIRRCPPGSVAAEIFGRDDLRPEYSRPLKQSAAGLPVRFHGAFRPGDAPALLARVDVVVVPSRWPENLPQSALEARAHGVPVVASAAGGLAEIVRDGVDGRVFAPGDSAALAKILEQLSSDRALLTGYASRIEQPPTVESHAAAIEAMYASLARVAESGH